MISERAIQLIADAKIQTAYEAGAFDRLSGFGRPFDFDDTTYDPNWWLRNKMKIESINLEEKSEASSR